MVSVVDFSRSIALLGDEAFSRLAQTHVAVVGIGGVGSWCAEALIRTGVRHLTLIDDDLVAPSNVNRQCPATSLTIGCPKVEVMRARLLEINPDAEVAAVRERYTGGLPCGGEIDAIADAIDSVVCKAELILAATAAGIPIVSSMGAALRLDPTKVEIKRFDKVAGDGLARALRQRFRRLGRFPASAFPCVTTRELPFCRAGSAIKGSLMPVTAAFGMVLAAEVIRMRMG